MWGGLINSSPPEKTWLSFTYSRQKKQISQHHTHFSKSIIMYIVNLNEQTLYKSKIYFFKCTTHKQYLYSLNDAICTKIPLSHKRRFRITLGQLHIGNQSPLVLGIIQIFNQHATLIKRRTIHIGKHIL